MRDTRYEFTSGWHSVEDGDLPKKGEIVTVVAWNRLCVRTDGLLCLTQPKVTKREYWGQDIKTGRHMWSKNAAVTHWMRLPDLPDGINEFSHRLWPRRWFK